MSLFEDKQRTSTPQKGAVNGPLRETDRRCDESTRGNVVVTTEQMVAEGIPLRDLEYGKLSEVVSNEKNNNKSVRRVVEVEDFYVNVSGKKVGLDDLGAENVTITVEDVDLTTQSALAAATPIDLLTLNSDVKRKDRVHGEKTTVAVEAWQQRTRTLVGDADAFGGDRQIITQVKAINDPFTVVANTLTKERKQLDSAKELQIITALGEGGAGTFTDYEEEPTSSKRVTVSRTLVDVASTPAVNATAGSVVTQKQTFSNKALRITRTIDPSILTETFIERHYVDYFFPAYLDADDPFTIVAGGWAPNKSGDQSLKVLGRFEITYHTAPTTPGSIFQFKTIDLHAQTYDYRLIVNDVIADAGSMVLVFGTTYSWFASSPSTTEYLALMGTEVLIIDDCVKWKYNLWRRTKVYITLPTLTEGFGSIGYEAP